VIRRCSKTRRSSGALHHLEELFLANAITASFRLADRFHDARRRTGGKRRSSRKPGRIKQQLNISTKITGLFFFMQRSGILAKTVGWGGAQRKLVNLIACCEGMGNKLCSSNWGSEILPAIRYVITLDADTILPQTPVT
jgi:hypothetical protein